MFKFEDLKPDVPLDRETVDKAVALRIRMDENKPVSKLEVYEILEQIHYCLSLVEDKDE